MLGKRDMPADAMLARSPLLPIPSSGSTGLSSIPSLSLSLSFPLSLSQSSVAKSAPPSDGSGEAPGRTLVPTSWAMSGRLGSEVRKSTLSACEGLVLFRLDFFRADLEDGELTLSGDATVTNGGGGLGEGDRCGAFFSRGRSCSRYSGFSSHTFESVESRLTSAQGR
jgi:hypothetical protein